MRHSYKIIIDLVMRPEKNANQFETDPAAQELK